MIHILPDVLLNCDAYIPLHIIYFDAHTLRLINSSPDAHTPVILHILMHTPPFIT